MKAIIRTKPGKNLSTMYVQELASPNPGNDEIKIRMAASRINPVDVGLMKGMPFVKYRKPQIGGIDGAGEVLEVGKDVMAFKPGDQVFFYRKFSDIGTWAEEIIIKAHDCAHIPKNLSLQQAGAIALPLLTAWEALRSLEAESGKKILIHGGAGGVGFQAVQLAQYLGLEVIATAAQQDFELLEQAGVSQLIDFRSQDFAQVLQAKSVAYVFDTVGKAVLLKSIALQPEKVVSLNYAEPDQLAKTGLNVPGFLKALMKLANRKFSKAAQRHQVQLLGQVTGANGTSLQEASDVVSNVNYQVKPYTTLSINQLEQNGFDAQALGKVIVFN